MTRQKIVLCSMLLAMNKYLDFMLIILPIPLINKPLNHHFLDQNSTVIRYWWPYYHIFQLPHHSQVTAHKIAIPTHMCNAKPPLTQHFYRCYKAQNLCQTLY